MHSQIPREQALLRALVGISVLLLATSAATLGTGVWYGSIDIPFLGGLL